MKTDTIVKLLPEIFQQTAVKGNPLNSFLSVMEVLHSDSEDILNRLDTFFDPHRTSEDFILFLSTWVDLDRIVQPDDSDRGDIRKENLRQLIANAWYLSKWRGTAKGLIIFLEIATGIKGFTVSETEKNKGGEFIPFHIAVHIPEQAEKMRHVIERIIEKEKPAYVTYEIKTTSTP